MPEIRASLSKYRLFDFFEFVIGVVTLIASVVTIWSFFTTAGPPLGVASVVALLLLCVVFFIKIIKLREALQDRLFTFAECIHKFTEVLRDEYYTLQQHFNSGQLTASGLRSHAQSTGQKCVDLLANALSVGTTEKVSVCIKYFPDDYPRPMSTTLQEEDYFVKTLCRSLNSATGRSSDSIDPVKGNTDFSVILNERRPYFRARDLRQLDRQLNASGSARYQNTHPNWSEHYVGTIVVPIRRRRALVESNISSDEYDILGFLCADSQSTSAFRESEIDAHTDLMRAFAAGLYLYLDRIYSYLQDTELRE